MRAERVIGCTVIAVALLALWALEGIVRGGTCGAAEGGGSCDTGVLPWLLLAGAIAALVAVLAIVPRRRPR